VNTEEVKAYAWTIGKSSAGAEDGAVAVMMIIWSHWHDGRAGGLPFDVYVRHWLHANKSDGYGSKYQKEIEYLSQMWTLGDECPLLLPGYSAVHMYKVRRYLRGDWE